MALEHFKTQVLLLHSEQSTLDALGARFNKKFAVHLATTGSEALTALSETPIHIIVSAQDLPGMSGLEALREAKRRSPDTIGILLTGERANQDIEALVGEQEVFQIVRGVVQPDILLQIVESAARRVRMMTISESANDNEAARPRASGAHVAVKALNPADSGEHIIMETMENGASMITDATGNQPVLTAEAASADGRASERSVDVLVLSNDQEFINTIRACARGLHDVHHATTAQEAQKIAAAHKVGVLVTDAAIAGNKVALLTQILRQHAPRLVAIVAGRRDDGESLMELINQGQVYRFLLKPVSPGRARLAIEACAKYHLDAPDSVFASRDKLAAATPDAAIFAPPAQAAVAPQPTAPAAPDAATKPAVDPLEQTDAYRVAGVAPPALDDSALDDQLRLPVIPATVAAVLLAAIGAWYLFGGPGDSNPVPAVQETASIEVAPAATPAAVPEETPAPSGKAGDAYLGLLDNARFARDSGRLFAPTGDNALEWYMEARLAAPDNVIVRDELAALVDQLLGMAESAMLENRIADVDAVLSMVALADPDNTRLAFVSAQRKQQQLRATLDDARAALRGERFEDAERLLVEAGQLPGADQAVIRQIRDDLNTARRAQRVDDVLELANARLAGGQLTAPANDNARYFFELAANNDPGNAAAQQGLLVVADRLVLSARAAIDEGNYAAAAELLEGARALNPDSPELNATEQALQKSLQLQAEASRRAAAARQSANQEVSATDAAAQRRRAAANATLTSNDAEPAPADEAEAESTTAEGAGAVPVAANAGASTTARSVEPTASAPVTVPASTNATPGAGAAQATEAAEAKPLEQVAISQLTRRNYVAPRYPRNARRREVSGWVDIAFTVLPDGAVGDIEIVDSMPGTVFTEAASEAVTQWRFEPIIEDGSPVAKRVAIRLSFALQ